MKYLVSPPEKSATWAITARELEPHIRARWPEARIALSSNPAEFHLLEWTAQTPEGACQLALARHGQALILDGAIEACANAALWFRSLVPDEVPLLFYDEAFNADVALTKQTTPEEIVRPFLA